MKKSIAILVSLVLCISLVGCSSKAKISCEYDINFVEYTDKPDFVEMIKGKIPLVPMEKYSNDLLPYTQEQVLECDSLITIKLNKKPSGISLREYWLNRNGGFINGASGPYTTTGSYAIDGKTVLIPIINRWIYPARPQEIYPDDIIYKGFEMVITFEDDIVEKYAFITKSEA